jgi:DNA-binding CsgD family transcriptional regulator
MEAQTPPIRMAIHLTARQFIQKNIVDTIKTILNDYDLSPNMLEIEVAESAVANNEDTVTRTLNELKALGIYITLDDFGTGYSSLSYLRRFPVHALKINKSFIQDLTILSSDTLSFISTIISIAHSFQMTVIAEGVETDEQLSLLRKYHCKEIQGYLFSPPVLPNEFEAFLLKSTSEWASAQPEKVAYIHKKQYSSVSDKSSLQRMTVSEPSEDQKQEILHLAMNQTKELYSISTREMEVFSLIVDGLSNKEISDKLFISEHTVKNHITRILQKLNVNDRLQAMAKVYQACIEEGKNLRAQ